MSAHDDFPTASSGSWLRCQVCGTSNPDDQEYCSKCQNKLLILSGPQHEDENLFEPEPEDGFSFDEHLLERISILEEVVKRSAETLQQVLGAVRKQEKNLLVNHTGLTALRELLEQRGLVNQEEWSELWESRMDEQLQAVQRREHFLLIREHIAGLYQGERRHPFVRLLDEAEAALTAYDLGSAITALERALKLDPRNYELSCFLGEAYFDQGDQEAALPFFLGALEVKPEHYGALVYGGALFYERGETQAAEELLKRAVEIYPDAFLPHFSLGAVYARCGEIARARVFLERAVQLDAVPQALYLLGSCLFEMGRPTPAVEHLEEAVKADPAFQEAYRLLGLACLERGWNRKARAALEKAQDLDPRPLDTAALAQVVFGGEPGPAPVATGEEPLSPLDQALAAFRQGLSGPALAVCRQGIAAQPDDAALLVLYALVNLGLERYRDVEAAARRALELTLESLATPEQAEALPGRLGTAAFTALVEAARGQGRYREGARLASELMERSSSDLGRCLAAYELAACSTEMEDGLDEALAWAQRSAELAPPPLEAAALAGLGWVRYRRGDEAAAADALARAGARAPSPATFTQLGMALLACGRSDEAREVLAQARNLGDEGRQLERRMVETLRESRRSAPTPAPPPPSPPAS